MVEVKRLNENELISQKRNEDSSTIKKRIENVRDIQKNRYKNKNIISNSHLNPKEIKQFCKFEKTGELILREAIKTFALTGRSYDRVLKISRTIADLANSDIIKDEHLLEALQFRFNLSNKT